MGQVSSRLGQLDELTTVSPERGSSWRFVVAIPSPLIWIIRVFHSSTTCAPTLILNSTPTCSPTCTKLGAKLANSTVRSWQVIWRAKSEWGPSRGYAVDLGPNSRKEAQLRASNFAKLDQSWSTSCATVKHPIASSHRGRNSHVKVNALARGVYLASEHPLAI